MRIDDADAFWSRIVKGEGCWEWPSGPSGYGLVTWQGWLRSTHRLAYELTYGPIPPGLCVCHHCDNPPCIRPDHLFLGTHADNMADARRKGHLRRPDPLVEMLAYLERLYPSSRRTLLAS